MLGFIVPSSLESSTSPPLSNRKLEQARDICGYRVLIIGKAYQRWPADAVQLCRRRVVGLPVFGLLVVVQLWWRVVQRIFRRVLIVDEWFRDHAAEASIG